MMIVDIRKLNAQKRYYGEMDFSYVPPEELMSIPFTKFDGPVEIHFEYDLYEDDAFEIHGKIRYKLKGQCSRCLKEAETAVEGDLEALFEPKKDAEDYSYSGGVIDLTQAVEEAIMLSLPFSLSCGDDCEAIRYSSETINENNF